MELTQNWKAFENYFVPRRRPSQESQSAQVSSPVFIVEESDVVLAILADGEQLEEWVGRTLSEVR